MYASLFLKLGLQAGLAEPCCKQKCSKSPIFPKEPCGGMEAQRELGMGGQTLGGLGDKHIGRTSMNSPRPRRACSSPPETGPGSTSAFYIVNCKTKTLVCVQCESLPASQTRASLNPAVAIFYVLHTGSVTHLCRPPRKTQGPPRWVTCLPSHSQPPLDI